MTMTPEFIESLKKAARRECWDENEDGTQMDDFCVYDYSGSNVDDAYAGGIQDGETQLARQVLTAMGVSWSETD